MTEIKETDLTTEVMEKLIGFSVDWENENSCHGYRRNAEEDLSGRRIFLAYDGKEVIGYLFGIIERSEKNNSIMPAGTVYFEVEELYVVPGRRSQGIGGQLFQYAARQLTGEAEFLMLSTATKNWKAILHFYLDELNMDFWSARLYKKL